jgi:pimeloyl-ACP methyl ester carboxylesterase
MDTVISRDGTAIAFERSGEGPPAIMMGGALNDRRTTEPLAELLAPRFTIFNYDRRGRGDSGDTAPYAMEREIEDLDAVITAAGGSAYLFANCTGGMLAVQAVSRGLPITRLAMYEPPYMADREPSSTANADYRARLGQLLAEGRRGDAVEYFMVHAAGIPPEIAASRRTLQVWPMIEALAPTLPYDAIILGNQSLPKDRLARITIPALVISGGASPEAQCDAGRALAEALPDGRHQTLDGHNHKLVAQAVAPLLTEFLGE